MSSSIKEALNKANINTKGFEKSKPGSVPYYLKQPYVKISKEFKYDESKYGLWNTADDQPTDNKNIQLMLASNVNRLYLLPRSLCQACCNIWIAYNRKYERFTVRGDPYFKLRNVPAYLLKHTQMRRLMDNYKISLDSSILDIIKVIDRKGMEQLIMVLYAESQNPIIMEIEDE